MWMMYATSQGHLNRRTIRVVDGDGVVRHSGQSVPEALLFLGENGQTEVGIPVADGVEVYLIERRVEPWSSRQGLGVRRDPLARGLEQGRANGLDLELPSEIRRSENCLPETKVNARWPPGWSPPSDDG